MVRICGGECYDESGSWPDCAKCSYFEEVDEDHLQLQQAKEKYLGSFCGGRFVIQDFEDTCVVINDITTGYGTFIELRYLGAIKNALEKLFGNKEVEEREEEREVTFIFRYKISNTDSLVNAESAKRKIEETAAQHDMSLEKETDIKV
ncbi:hypothetical protein KAU11_12245 [Candidatus Babeliales bacterium]|nr:hypothetical protein [Candidatus Babeliales bacterium]